MTDVGHKPGREKTARYITDNVLDPAPAKGATYRFDHGNSELTGFNPRTRKGCDENSGTKGSGGVCFNPRPREGCDVPDGYKINADDNVSIHAPVKGATAPLSGPVNRAFQRHFARTSFFSPENKGGFPNIFYFTCIFNRLAMRASHGGKSVHLGCPHRQTG